MAANVRVFLIDNFKFNLIFLQAIEGQIIITILYSLWSFCGSSINWAWSIVDLISYPVSNTTVTVSASQVTVSFCVKCYK